MDLRYRSTITDEVSCIIPPAGFTYSFSSPERVISFWVHCSLHRSVLCSTIMAGGRFGTYILWQNRSTLVHIGLSQVLFETYPYAVARVMRFMCLVLLNWFLDMLKILS